MKPFDGWTLFDFWMLFVAGVVCIALLLGFVLGGAMVVSKIDCEFRPTTERCTVLNKRERGQW